MRANMQYNKTLIEKAVKFINNKNVEVEHFVAKDDETFNVCVDVHNNRIWTDGDGLWSTVAKGVKVRHANFLVCLLYTSPSPRDRQKSRMPSSA